MKRNLAGISLLLFGISVVFLIAMTLFEARLTALSTAAERILTFLLLILPPAIGALFGFLSLARKEARTWLAVIGIVLNTLFTLFHSMIILFAG